MLKYVDTKVVFAEIPDEITLAINISNCPCHCKGCHSPYLAEDIGKVLIHYNKQGDNYITSVDEIIESNLGITCVAIMGGDSEPILVNELAKYIKCNYDDSLKVAWYSGKSEIDQNIDLKNFDYIKVGPYIEEKGPLNNPNTNQRLYEVNRLSKLPDRFSLKDITYKFWKNEDIGHITSDTGNIQIIND